jgi:hypothetical protein
VKHYQIYWWNYDSQLDTEYVFDTEAKAVHYANWYKGKLQVSSVSPVNYAIVER